MLKFLPWRLIIRHAARRYGVIDPIAWVARVRAFSRPSEVQEPIELLRAGIVFHARGLVNVKAIQHNLDWIWPFWVERQFKPGDPSFVPRAFSFSHINLTHRNWTTIGLPDVPVYPIVDPRGLITPLHDGWSIDFWIVPKHTGSRLFPSKSTDEETHQTYSLESGRQIVQTTTAAEGNKLTTEATMVLQNGIPRIQISVTGQSTTDAWLIAAIRPYNPEGIQFIDSLAVTSDELGITVNDKTTVRFSEKPDGTRMAHYEDGDVYHNLAANNCAQKISCDAGMATAAVLFDLPQNHSKSFRVEVSLQEELEDRKLAPIPHSTSWEKATKGLANLEVADARTQFLFDTALRTLVLLSAGELVPGPNTYRRFWFRDACLMMAPMLAIGLINRCERMLSSFPPRQTMAGYFLSQEGEWDSNGQVLWIAARISAITGSRLDSAMENSLVKAVNWLAKKRLPENHPPAKSPPGLLPAGFSAEHLGPNDFYYWDNFWALAGLREITRYWQTHRESTHAATAEKLATEYATAIERSISQIPQRKARGGIPAAPGRRMDAGAIGSMVADYPLHIYPPGEARIMKTTEILMAECFHRGGFFQQMIHSGINAYLTLDLAQTLLRAEDPRFADLIRATAELASPTGQWPEAIHPNTLGGCMGDGQHGWAAAEWIMMIRNCFVREESNSLIIGSGILPEWLASGRASFGPTFTPWGQVGVSLTDTILHIDASWRGDPPPITVAVPGFAKIQNASSNEPIPLARL